MPLFGNVKKSKKPVSLASANRALADIQAEVYAGAPSNELTQASPGGSQFMPATAENGAAESARTRFTGLSRGLNSQAQASRDKPGATAEVAVAKKGERVVKVRDIGVSTNIQDYDRSRREQSEICSKTNVFGLLNAEQDLLNAEHCLINVEFGLLNDELNDLLLNSAVSLSNGKIQEKRSVRPANPLNDRHAPVMKELGAAIAAKGVSSRLPITDDAPASEHKNPSEVLSRAKLNRANSALERS